MADSAPGRTSVEKIIKAAVERGASDLHIKAGDVFRARINGELVPLTKQRLTPEQTRAIAQRLMSSDEDRARIDRVRDFDCSWGMPGVGRFRVNVLRQRSSFMIVMRVIPFTVPSFDSLGLPEEVRSLAEIDRGLLFIAGVSGSGKSSTVAAIVHQINTTRQRHIVTIENPIEFLHRDLTSSVTQREVGVDTDSLAEGLHAALRQDPDVVVIGDVSEAETAAVALKAAESGRLVIAVLPTTDAITSIQHFVTMLPAEERAVGRLRLADSLQAAMAQQLLPRADGSGRIAAVEVLRINDSARDLIREPEREAELREIMSKNGDMLTFTQHMNRLVKEATIEKDTAKAATRSLGEATT